MAETTSRKQEEAQEATQPRERLVAESEAYLGVPPHVVAGALANERKQNFTVSETKELIKEFQKLKVDLS